MQKENKIFWERDWLPAAQPRASQSQGAKLGLHINPEKFEEGDSTARGRCLGRGTDCDHHQQESSGCSLLGC